MNSIGLIHIFFLIVWQLNLIKFIFPVLNILYLSQFILSVHALDNAILVDVNALAVSLLFAPFAFVLFAICTALLPPALHQPFAPLAFVHVAVGHLVLALPIPDPEMPLTDILGPICPFLDGERIPAVVF